ncbi:MAG: hypothetical protein RLZZ214_475 [Verrucomicrobiota bacterium]
MSANPYSSMICDRPAVAPNTRAGSNSSVMEADDSFSRCMPRVVDYDAEWMSFVHQHATRSYRAEGVDFECDALPRVWNLPHD